MEISSVSGGVAAPASGQVKEVAKETTNDASVKVAQTDTVTLSAEALSLLNKANQAGSAETQGNGSGSVPDIPDAETAETQGNGSGSVPDIPESEASKSALFGNGSGSVPDIP